jgi:Choline/Carnitine o-acyltransferase
MPCSFPITERFPKQTGVCYESAQTRKFALGRTEVIRAASSESRAWAEAMLSEEGKSNEEQMALFKKAVNRNLQYAAWAADGQGVDRHLFGLKKLLKEGEETPRLYEDVAYGRTNHWELSTSNLSSKWLDGWGYGEGQYYIGRFFSLSSFRDAFRADLIVLRSRSGRIWLGVFDWEQLYSLDYHVLEGPRPQGEGCQGDEKGLGGSSRDRQSDVRSFGPGNWQDQVIAPLIMALMTRTISYYVICCGILHHSVQDSFGLIPDPREGLIIRGVISYIIKDYMLIGPLRFFSCAVRGIYAPLVHQTTAKKMSRLEDDRITGNAYLNGWIGNKESGKNTQEYFYVTWHRLGK